MNISAVKLIAFALTLNLFSIASAQEQGMELTKETIEKTYELDQGKEKTPYVVTIKNKETSVVKLDEKDKNKINQDRVETPEMVTKVISINDDANDAFDNVIELSYIKEADNDFNIFPAENGFLIRVKGREFNYSVEDKNYIIEKEDEDFFKVEKAVSSF
ncbi:hypothetical protein ACE939_04960 [Aquimarina sp. W85]|uniref:hypothetical protein n=1 Tax=Aquimarina rhodophyticola TaxID=3342246 RepID=UPI00366F3780